MKTEETIEITKDKLTSALKRYAKETGKELTKVAIGISLIDGKPVYELTDESETHLKPLKLKEIFSLTILERTVGNIDVDTLYPTVEKFLVEAFGRFALSETNITGKLHAYIKIRKQYGEPEAFLCDDEKFIRQIEIGELIKTE